ncbi:MAG: 4Fe-4S binding protein, partial [Deltaproteobacteria bacterium]|nr:4Fe-4S binding protein [Deltaproteobacteria bacterium]
RIARIDVKCGARVGEGKLTLERINDEGFDAVFIAKGTPTPRTLFFAGEQVEGQDLSGVMYGHTFLYEVSHGNIPPHYFQGKQVTVIGGGNVAFDVARTARRLGGDTTVLCLECEDKDSPDGIPADSEEIRGAWQEGIRIIYSRGVSRIFGEGERVKGIDCPRCTSVFDETGFDPQFDTSDCMYLATNILIITVGQGPDKTSLKNDDLLDNRGRLAVDLLTLQSLKRENAFIGGDLRRIGFMADAMKDGLVAAESIVRYLTGQDLKKGRKRDYEVQDTPLKRLYQTEPEVLWIPPEKRLHFQLYERGFTLREAVEEARRCLCCGPCVSCKACVSLGIQKALPLVEVTRDRCCGCGICVSACFYGAAQIRIVEDRLVSTIDTFRCKSCGMCVEACPSGARRLIGDKTENQVREVYASL